LFGAAKKPFLNEMVFRSPIKILFPFGAGIKIPASRIQYGCFPLEKSLDFFAPIPMFHTQHRGYNLNFLKGFKMTLKGATTSNKCELTKRKYMKVHKTFQFDFFWHDSFLFCKESISNKRFKTFCPTCNSLSLKVASLE